MVEFSLVLPLLAMLLFGLISAALMFDANMQLTHATREGVRHGATLPETQVFVSGTWATNLRAFVIEREGGNLVADDVCVALVVGNPAVAVSANHTTSSGTGGRCFDDTTGAVERRVQVSTRRSMPLEVVAFSQTVTLSSKATMRHETNG